MIGVCWSDYRNFKKSDWKSLICNNRDCYNVAIEYFKGLIGIPYDFIEDKKEQYQGVLLQELLRTIPFACEIKPNKSAAEEIYELTYSMCNQFKRLVENMRLSEILYRKIGNLTKQTGNYYFGWLLTHIKMPGNLMLP